MSSTSWSSRISSIALSTMAVVVWVTMPGMVYAAAASASEQQTAAQPGATVQGVVVDAKTGAPLERVQVWFPEAASPVETDSAGRFELRGIAPGRRVLHLSAVNYVLTRRDVELTAGRVEVLTIQMVGGAGTYNETVDVVAAAHADTLLAPSRQHLDGVELQRLSGGLLDDPTRAVQALPGVTTGDDFHSEFSVRGSGPRSIGTTFEGVTTTLLTHTWHQEDDGSVSMVNGTVLERMSLMRGAYPQRVGGRTGAWLDISMREGPRDRPEARATTSMTSTSATVGGPIGKSRRGSYLIGGRWNYIDKLLALVGATGQAGFSLLDTQGKVVYDASGRHQVQVAWVGGRTVLDMESERDRADPGDDYYTVNGTGLVTGAVRSTLGARLMVTNRVAVVTNRYHTDGFFRSDLQRSSRTEWSYRGDLVFSPSAAAVLEAGWASGRAAQNYEVTDYWWTDASRRSLAVTRHDQYDARGWTHGGYALLRWSQWPRVTISPGVRVDRFTMTRQTAASPWLQASWRPAKRTEVGLGVSVSHQYPEYWQILGMYGGGTGLRAERAVNADLAFSHGVSDRSRLQVTLYNRSERDGLRLRNGEIQRYPWGIYWPGQARVRYVNAVEAYSRGVELEWRSGDPNGLSGWISYALSFTKAHDVVRGERYWGDYDQRHTLNLFAQYRWTPTTGVSGRFRCGSNFPLAGYYEQRLEPVSMPDGTPVLDHLGMPIHDTFHVVSDRRNTERVPAYARLDVRLDRAFVVAKRRLTLFAEITNLFGRENVRQESQGFWRLPNGTVVYNEPLRSLFPLMPSFGVMIEF